MLQVSLSGCACAQPHLQAYVATTIATRANTMQLYPAFPFGSSTYRVLSAAAAAAAAARASAAAAAVAK